VPVRRGGRIATSGAPVSERDLHKLLRLADRPGEPGRVLPVPDAGSFGLLLLTGIGAGTPVDLRRAGAAAGRAARAVGRLAVLAPEGGEVADPAAAATPASALARAAALATYRYRVAGAGATSGRPGSRLAEIVIVSGAGSAAARREVDLLGQGLRATWLARDLANTPSLDKSPEWLAEAAREIAAKAHLEVSVMGEDGLAEQGFGGLLAVGAGSARPPRLIRLDYRPPAASRHVVLVGKGITFDSGGLDLKPLAGMTMMKTDMAGAGAVLAACSVLAEAGVPHRVTGLIAAAENLPSGSALRPGDVIRHYDGHTVEVLNTDAEGRLVLADAIGYAVRNLAPDCIVDLATLTGAATQALGRRHAALYSTQDALAAELCDGATRAGEGLWRMPLVEDYRAALDSDIADLRNIADPAFGFSGGSIIAALFLREFTGGVPWAHLDIAGPARAESDDADSPKGATGYGARTLLYWLASGTTVEG
jgi:leucyl aminopeptidase